MLILVIIIDFLPFSSGRLNLRLLVVSLQSYYSEACSEPRQTYKMEHLTKLVNSFEPLTIFAIRSILHV